MFILLFFWFNPHPAMFSSLDFFSFRESGRRVGGRETERERGVDGRAAPGWAASRHAPGARALTTEPLVFVPHIPGVILIRFYF